MRRRVVLTIVTALLLLISTGQVVGSAPEGEAAGADRYDVLGSGPGYGLAWWTVDGGGGASDSATGYRLMGTAGQPDTGVWEGNGYALGGGFWGGGALAVEHHVYLPLVTRDF